MFLTGLKYISGLVADLVAIMILVVTMVSCSNDGPDIGTGEDQTGMISFRLVTPKSTPASRATWNDEYEALGGNDFETTLLNDELYVMITDKQCSQQFAVTNLICTRRLENALLVVYEYTGRVNQEEMAEIAGLVDGKLHIIANSGYKPQLDANTTFTLMGKPGLGFNAIPMWGVIQKDDLSGLTDPNSIFYIGDVSLLRAMAKVVISNDPSDYNNISSIERVTISKANSTGYLLPQGWLAIDNTRNLERNAIRIPDQIEKQTVGYNFIDNKVEFYLPELKNSDNDEISLELDFTTISGEKRKANLYFRNYNSFGQPEGMPYDIRRNYLYEYSVSMLRDLSAKVDVVPYTSVELDPGFGFITPLPTVPDEGENPGWVEIKP